MSRDLPWEDDYAPAPRSRPQPRQREVYADEHEEAPAPRRRKAAAARSPLWDFVRARPLDSLAACAAGVFCLGILFNGLALQKTQVAVVEKIPVVVAAAPKFTNEALVAPAPSGFTTARVMTIEEAQRELTKRGLYTDSIDGKMGSRTTAAIKEFQKYSGLRVTGEVNDEVSIALKQAPLPLNNRAVAAAPPKQVNIADLISNEEPVARKPEAKKPLTTSANPVAKGEPARPVYVVERTLSQLGYGPIKVDGIFGNDTRQSIEAFERDRKIAITGSITPRLMKELSSVTGTALE